ncbi:helix-turn-helix transcriptional regulator [Deinococcus lacus]|uniref:Helix-turn-helix transcriptional regulator n=1 Tax=Deinococcus lacus TaxID=392561 RepID=A0ABW1YDJ3_9DEIO
MGETLGRRMAIARAAQKKTLQGVADEMDKAKSTISQWENDIYQPSLKDIARLASVLNVNQNWLAFGDKQ